MEMLILVAITLMVVGVRMGLEIHGVNSEKVFKWMVLPLTVAMLF